MTASSFRELFPIGLTALDPIEEATDNGALTSSQISARREVESLVEALALPTRAARRRAHGIAAAVARPRRSAIYQALAAESGRDGHRECRRDAVAGGLVLHARPPLLCSRRAHHRLAGRQRATPTPSTFSSFARRATSSRASTDLDPFAEAAHPASHVLDFAEYRQGGLAPKGRFSRAVFRRLFLDRLLPETYARYVAIDADMLIARPGLARLGTVDLGPHAFGAAYDMIFLMDFKGGPLAREFQGYRRALGLDLTTPYFNAGLMAVDRARWRAAGYADEAAARLRGQPEKYPFMEQDALNSLVRGAFAPLSPRLNFMGDFFLTGLEPEIAPVVWHFVNQPKPWDLGWRGEARFARAYRDWFAQAPFPDWRPTGAPLKAGRKPAASALRRRFAQNLRGYLSGCVFVDA